MDLEFLNRKRVAVVLREEGRDRVVLCTGDYRKQASDPGELALHLDEFSGRGGSPAALVLIEDEWSGEIHSDAQYGCPYRIELELQV